MMLVAGFVLNQECRRVAFYLSFIWIIFTNFVPKEHGKGYGRAWNQMGKRNPPRPRVCR